MEHPKRVQLAFTKLCNRVIHSWISMLSATEPRASIQPHLRHFGLDAQAARLLHRLAFKCEHHCRSKMTESSIS